MRPITVHNSSRDEAPPYAVLRVTGVLPQSEDDESLPILTIDKPNHTSTHVILLNGPVPIPAGKVGQATQGPAIALYYGGEIPRKKEKWGPEDDSWELVKGQPGATVLADGANGRVLVSLTPMSSHGGLSGSGELTVDDDQWVTLSTILTGEQLEPFGLAIEGGGFRVYRYGCYHVYFAAGVESKTIAVDLPDNVAPEFALFRDGQRAHQEIGSQVRLIKSKSRQVTFTGFVIAAGGHLLDIRVRATENEIQRITLGSAGGDAPTGGTLTLTFDGQTTAPIAWNATAADVQAALEALSNIDPGDVSCTGGPLVQVTFGVFYNAIPVDVEFTGQYENTNVPQMTAVQSLTGVPSPFVNVVTVQGPDNLIFDSCTFTVASVSGFTEELPTTTTTTLEPPPTTTTIPPTTTTLPPTTTTTQPPTTTTQGPTTTTTHNPTTTSTTTTTTEPPPTTTTTEPPPTTTTPPPTTTSAPP